MADPMKFSPNFSTMINNEIGYIFSHSPNGQFPFAATISVIVDGVVREMSHAHTDAVDPLNPHTYIDLAPLDPPVQQLTTNEKELTND